MKKIFHFVFFMFSSFSLLGQSLNDTSKVLTFDSFYGIIINNHPIVKQAELLPLNAQQSLRLAKGAFDPKLQGDWNYKRFKGTEYYNTANVGIKIPTWFPVDPILEIDRNTGEFLNPERSIPNSTNNRQIFAGVSIPLGKGLFIDQRRATYKQAVIFQDLAEVEQIKAINKLLLTAAKDYWQWYYAYNNYQLMLQGITIAEELFDRTKSAYSYGEVAAIDTVQAKITLLKRRLETQNALNDWQNATLTLSNHLWSTEGIPLELTSYVTPEITNSRTVSAEELVQLVELAKQNHPEIRKINLKTRSLLVDQSLAKESLKPKLDIKYGFIDQPFNPQGESNGFEFTDNVKAGVNFSYPLFLRKERSKIKQIKYKITGNELKKSYKTQQITNEINSVFNTVSNARQTLGQQQEMVANYQLIVAAERLNLQNGESDLFKINLQLEKLIESQTKLLKLRTNYQKNIAELYWTAGVVNLGFGE